MQVILKDKSEEKPVYEGLIKNLESLISGSKEPSEQTLLNTKVKQLKDLWCTLDYASDHEMKKEKELYTKTKHMDDKMNEMEKLVNSHKDKLFSLQPVSCSPEKLAIQQAEINVKFFIQFLFIV